MKKYLIILVFILMIFKADAYAVNMNFTGPEEVTEENLSRAVQGQNKKTDQNQAREAIVRPKLEYTATGLRDPFQLAAFQTKSDKGKDTVKAVVAKSFPKLTLQGIIWGSSLPQAIINNKVIRVGDTLESVDIVDIGKEGVIVLFAGTEYKLITQQKSLKQKEEL
ncbi:MAG: hypothetical protein COT38_01120 [Candidatus Omnitrophica bacterium CG08_land_8_20_14_0_20_41_16]|uniref:Type II secretion system protein GspC N-terminal domain-containing protein n=1 Tax=Candidatus Sherwoodlollariibacterium unditelluris TaxID=1974757 RepID=A0A2G9YHN3_9BACT|nr:MAG: hypothetical protein COX41_06615 [Candidatus Omnitrophica bacterium CG23_combo_of_CG06-09_8_20_14_all_41_10]PIS34241.1 MAG: hypothetical protein COT38_01120 [Candidatus Omnitrophica bacterium CG08_land_8_20_14_0_20_41_16]